MAAITLPAPGTKLGPCEPSCTHTDCALTRQQAAEPCGFCGKPTGYETRFYGSPGNQAHAICLEKEAG